MGDRETDRKENGEKRFDRSPEDSNANDYTRAKALWTKFIRGEITSKQLDEIVSGFNKNIGQEDIGDLYGEN